MNDKSLFNDQASLGVRVRTLRKVTSLWGTACLLVAACLVIYIIFASLLFSGEKGDTIFSPIPWLVVGVFVTWFMSILGPLLIRVSCPKCGKYLSRQLLLPCQRARHLWGGEPKKAIDKKLIDFLCCQSTTDLNTSKFARIRELFFSCPPLDVEGTHDACPFCGVKFCDMFPEDRPNSPKRDADANE